MRRLAPADEAGVPPGETLLGALLELDDELQPLGSREDGEGWGGEGVRDRHLELGGVTVAVDVVAVELDVDCGRIRGGDPHGDGFRSSGSSGHGPSLLLLPLLSFSTR